jgi:hypothetical protein
MYRQPITARHLTEPTEVLQILDIRILREKASILLIALSKIGHCIEDRLLKVERSRLARKIQAARAMRIRLPNG